MPYTIVQPRRDTPANWESNNIVLAMGETGYELTGSPLRCTAQKIGDGVTAWVDLPYATSVYDADIIHKTGDETIAGQKRFGVAPLMPSDICFWMDGQSGRPAFAAWQADQSIEVTTSLQAALDSGYHTLTMQTGAIFVSGPLTVSHKITLISVGSMSSASENTRPIIKLKPSASGHLFTVASGAVLKLRNVALDGNKANQGSPRHGIYCPTAGSTYAESTELYGAAVSNFSGDGISLEKNRNKLIVSEHSEFYSNDGHAIYGAGSMDAYIFLNRIGDSGLSNISMSGLSDLQCSNIRIIDNDIWGGGRLGQSDGNNITIGDYVRSVIISNNEIFQAYRYGVCILETSLGSWATASIIGNRFSGNSYGADNTYSDIYCGHAGVSISSPIFGYQGATNLVKYLVELGTALISADNPTVMVTNPVYTAASYRTGRSNKIIPWISKELLYMGRNEWISFNSSATSSILESYGSSNTRFIVRANGTQYFGDGTNATDANFSRTAAGVLGVSGDFSIAGHRVTYGTAAPTTGTWAVGDRCFNSAPAVGQPKGWVCTVAGTPGTWVSEGNL